MTYNKSRCKKYRLNVSSWCNIVNQMLYEAHDMRSISRKRGRYSYLDEKMDSRVLF